MARLSRRVEVTEILADLMAGAGGVVLRRIDLGYLLVLRDGVMLESGTVVPALRMYYANMTLFSDHNMGVRARGSQAGVSRYIK